LRYRQTLVYNVKSSLGLIRLNRQYRLLYIFFGIWFSDDRRVLQILIVKARTESRGKKPRSIFLPELASDRQR